MAPFHGHNIPFLPCVNQGTHVGSAGWKSWAMRSAFSFLGADFEFQLSSAKHHGLGAFHLTLLFTWSNTTFQWNSPVFSRVTHMQTENLQCFRRIQHHLPPPKRTLVWIFQPMNLMIPVHSFTKFVELLFNFPLVKATRSSLFSLVGTNSSYLIDSFLGFRTPPKQ